MFLLLTPIYEAIMLLVSFKVGVERQESNKSILKLVHFLNFFLMHDRSYSCLEKQKTKREIKVEEIYRIKKLDRKSPNGKNDYK